MSRIGGYATLTDRESGRIIAETDTFRCNHCGFQTHAKQRRPEDIGGMCKLCMGLTCARCVGKPCDVLEAKLDRVERTQDMRRWLLECS